ncbi:MAG TPA: hypothetical protein VIB38_04095 [Aestuariivirgaceae bacterium]
MNASKPQDSEQPTESVVDYIIHQYGLTREEARDVVRQCAGDPSRIDAEAGRLRAQKKS